MIGSRICGDRTCLLYMRLEDYVKGKLIETFSVSCNIKRFTFSPLSVVCRSTTVNIYPGEKSS